MTAAVWAIIGRIIEAILSAPVAEREARAKRALEVALGSQASEEILKRALGRKR